MAAVATTGRSEARRRGYPTPHRCLDCPAILTRRDSLRCHRCANRRVGAQRAKVTRATVCVECNGAGHRQTGLTLEQVHRQDLWCRPCKGGPVAEAFIASLNEQTTRQGRLP